MQAPPGSRHPGRSPDIHWPVPASARIPYDRGTSSPFKGSPGFLALALVAGRDSPRDDFATCSLQTVSNTLNITQPVDHH